MNENTIFPGRPDYTGPTTGFFGLLHHNILFEPSDDVMERVTYVRSEKPFGEKVTRLHNMIFLGDCTAATKRAPLYAEIVDYIRARIPDCAWDGSTLRFTSA